MKKLKILLDKLILSKLSVNNVSFNSFIIYHVYQIYSEIMNYFKYRDKYFFYQVNIEISTYCNRKCWYCPNKDNETPKEFMEWSVIEKIIAELKALKYTGLINYAFYNEPMFDDRLLDIVRYVNKELPNTIQILTTNGDLLNAENAEALIQAGINKFFVTVHDKNPKKNLDRLKPVKDVIGYHMILKTSSDLYLQNRGGLIDIEEDKKFNFYKDKCQHIRELVITQNGDIVLCCHDYYRKHVMGNIMEKPLLEIWKSYSKLRYDLLKRRVVNMDICKRCLQVNKE